MKKSFISLLPILAALGHLTIFSLTAQVPPSTDAKKEPIHFAIALAQPEETKTVAWLNAAPLWQGESFPGYGFGEWSWPSGMLTLALKNPQREDLNFKTQTTSGECYLLGVDTQLRIPTQRKRRNTHESPRRTASPSNPQNQKTNPLFMEFHSFETPSIWR